MAGKNKSAVKVVEETREPVTARGVVLLRLIAATGGMYLTQEEAIAEVNAGNATVDANNVQGECAFVTLTEQGEKVIAEAAPTANASVSRGKSQFEVDDDVDMPESTRTALRGSKYPFDKLQVGQSFHVPATTENPDPVAALASSVTGARRRFSVPVLENGRPVMAAETVKRYKLDANGKRIKDENGHWIVEGTTVVQRQKMTMQRDFKVVAVGAEDKRGPGARVFRTK